MLVLSRKCTQQITIGDDIKVTVVAILGDRVRLGIEAPKVTPIMRPDAVKKEASDD